MNTPDGIETRQSSHHYIKLNLPFKTNDSTTPLVTGLCSNHLMVELGTGITPASSIEGAVCVNNQTQFPMKLRLQRDEVDGANHKALGFPADAVSTRRFTDLLHFVRKNQHIEICQSQDVEAKGGRNGFEAYEMVPRALPELNWDDLDTRVRFCGQDFALPILIAGMTGGVEKGETINRRLAELAERYDIPMGVGSQRMALDNKSLENIFQLKDRHPKMFLIGNIGIAQLKSEDYLDRCRRCVDMIGADALAIHVNVLQESLQIEGDKDFRGIIERIGHVASILDTSIIVKEVGCGLDRKTLTALNELPIAAVDVGGKGGTAWGYIEGLRSDSEDHLELAKLFRNWGVPTAKALVEAKRTLAESIEVIATGGVRDGVTVAKACGLGANLVGIGLPLLRASLISEDKLEQVMANFVKALKITMLCTGSKTVEDLRPNIVKCGADIL